MFKAAFTAAVLVALGQAFTKKEQIDQRQRSEDASFDEMVSWVNEFVPKRDRLDANELAFQRASFGYAGR